MPSLRRGEAEASARQPDSRLSSQAVVSGRLDRRLLISLGREGAIRGAPCGTARLLGRWEATDRARALAMWRSRDAASAESPIRVAGSPGIPHAKGGM